MPGCEGQRRCAKVREGPRRCAEGARRAWKEWSRHAWLHAMHVLMRSASPALALLKKKGSARKGRAIETRSAWPPPRMVSAISGVLMRLVATSGTVTEPRSFCVTHAKPPRGTDVAIVGMRASCQPMPVLISDAPAHARGLEGTR